MRILVIGRDGQLGQSLREVAAGLGVAQWADLTFVDRETIDFADEASMEKTIADIRPDVVINAAAYTAVDRAEDEAQLAFQLNAAGAKALAMALAEQGGRADPRFNGLRVRGQQGWALRRDGSDQSAKRVWRE